MEWTKTTFEPGPRDEKQTKEFYQAVAKIAAGNVDDEASTADRLVEVAKELDRVRGEVERIGGMLMRSEVTSAAVAVGRLCTQMDVEPRF